MFEDDKSTAIALSNRTFIALNNLYDNLIEINKLDPAKKLKETNPLAYAKEYGTIKLCGPRQSGHSTSIIKFIETNFVKASGGKCFVISAKLKMALDLRTKINTYFSDSGCKLDYCDDTQSCIYNKDYKYDNRFASRENGTKIYYGMIRGLTKSLDMIIVDCASFFSKNQIDQIYSTGIELMKNNDRFTFIFME
jgi:hypothetical protein